MTAQPVHHDPDRTPKAIRAVLPERDREAFDREYRAAMARATEELDLTPATEFLDRWWPIAVLQSRGEYEQVMQTAETLLERAARGEGLGTRPWAAGE